MSRTAFRVLPSPSLIFKLPGTVVVLLAICLALSGCGLRYSQRAPEVLYSEAASSNRSLQIPPDLTDISDGEQYVLPGNTGGVVARNTLLPQFQNARFERQGRSNWLEIEASAEALWPELLSFLRQQGHTVVLTDPLSGRIETQWQAAVSNSGGSVFKTLLGKSGNTPYHRLALRLERNGKAARVFAQVQQTDKQSALATGADQLTWSDQLGGSNSESASLVLQRLLLHLGVEEQLSKGIISSDTAASIGAAAILEKTAGGTQLLVHRGYQQTFRSITQSLKSLGMEIQDSDASIGQIKTVDIRETPSPVYTLKLEPMHVSAVKVSVLNSLGEPLNPRLVEQLLVRIRDALV